MKNYLCIALVCLVVPIFCQSNYIEYAHNMREIRKLLMAEEYELSYSKFHQSTKNIDYIFSNDLRMFSAICLNVGKCDEGLEAYKIAVKQGFDYTTDYLEFFRNKCTNFNQTFEDQLKIEYKKYIISLKSEYCDAINTYYEIDQNTRQKHETGKVTQHEFKNIDSTVIANILPFIENYGIADERMISNETTNKLFIIMLHFDEDKSNNILGPYLLEALLKGKIKPENYAWIIDRRRVWGNKLKPYYYQILNGYDELTESEIKSIDERRRLIGCRPLSDYNISKELDGNWIMSEK